MENETQEILTYEYIGVKGARGDKGEGSIMVSSSVSPHLYELHKKYNIKWSEVLRVGMAVILAERGLAQYDNNLNLFRRMQVLRKELEETSQKYVMLQEEIRAKDLLKTLTDTKTIP